MSLGVSISSHPFLPFWPLLLPSSVPAMTFPAHCLPIHMPGCWAGRAQPHPGCALMGAPRPGSQRGGGASGRLRQTSTCCFPGGGTEAQRGHRPYPGSHSWNPHASPTQVLPCAIKWIQSCHLTLGGIRVTLAMLVGEQLGNRQHDTSIFPHPSAPPHPGSAHWEARRLQGSTGNRDSRSFVRPGRFSGLLCVSLSSLSLSQGLLSAKVI